MAAAPSPTDYRALLARQDWAALHKALKLFAWRATGSRSMSRAEDLAQDATAQLWAGTGERWNPEIQPSLLRFLTGIVRGELSNQRRLKRTTHEVATEEEDLAEHEDADRPAPDAQLIAHERAHRVFASLRARAARDAVATQIVALFESGEDGAAEQAAASGLPIEDIRRGRRRVFDHAAAVARENDDENGEMH